VASTSQLETFVNLPVHPPVKDAVERIRNDLTKKGVKVKSQSDVVQICVTAYDIMYGSAFGDRFTSAVSKALNEVNHQ
jgi:hypothetical protein